jgi:hypothetical protein
MKAENVVPENNDESQPSLKKIEVDPASYHPLYSRSVCINCANHRTIVSGTGSVFMLCQSKAISSGWPKYPPQPLYRCPHFESISTAERPKSG